MVEESLKHAADSAFLISTEYQRPCDLSAAFIDCHQRTVSRLAQERGAIDAALQAAFGGMQTDLPPASWPGQHR